MKRDERIELARLLEELNKRRSRITIRNYRPYAKQLAFHAGGKTHRERLFLAGNQDGKTIAGGCEFGFHLTGRYPDWWPGRRWDRPVAMWAAGVTSESTRDNPQRVLLGRGGEDGDGSIGSGTIPGDLIVHSSLAMRRGVANAIDGVRVKHVSGGTSLLLFKSFDQGREKWQGDTLDAVWFDEEPPKEIYMEGLTRTNATGGMTAVTATPLKGRTDVINFFYPEPNTKDRHVTQMSLYEVGHYTPADHERIIAQYPPHERDARVYGIPMLGGGRCYPLAEEAVMTPAFVPPAFWPQIGGLDFGWTHPTAAVRLVWDRDNDVVFVTAVHRLSEASVPIHAAALKPWGDGLPFAWPHDGENQTAAGAGEQLAKQYARHGLKMLDERASFEDDRKASVEAGIAELLERMQTGRLKAFSNLVEWRDEFLQYHREDGRVKKVRDDLMDATRYGVMMLRHAKVLKPKRNYLRGIRRQPSAGFMAG